MHFEYIKLAKWFIILFIYLIEIEIYFQMPTILGGWVGWGGVAGGFQHEPLWYFKGFFMLIEKCSREPIFRSFFFFFL